ncbi:MAG: serpin family protein [Candidatus Omnitrophica bacterium]|nr:serpin family protein [Candidatus Omnitrophota bacterium]MBU1995727.1 serpin family protein [Candidatus Omnitrophota bacterium]
MNRKNIFNALLMIAFAYCCVISSKVFASDKEISSLVNGNNGFAIDLYKELKDEDGNLFFSPYSISTALAMTYAGARGNTEVEIAEVLHFDLGQDSLHKAFGELEGKINAVEEMGDVQLNIANALWLEKEYIFLDEYLSLVGSNYSAAFKTVDFSNSYEDARLEINGWVKDKTNNKIMDLLAPGAVDSLTRLVLTNAIYFKGDWLEGFKEIDTKDKEFWLTEADSVIASLMYQEEEFKYMENDSLMVLELPYKGEEVSMVVLLPKEKEGLSTIEEVLSIENLNMWISDLGEQEIKVFLPKFKLESKFELKDNLSSMGMPDAFSSNSDFSGIDGTDLLYISKIIHKAFVDVDEKGTEAAAATAVVMTLRSMAAATPIFLADHPFMFLIKESKTGSILFLGRLVNPLK